MSIEAFTRLFDEVFTQGHLDASIQAERNGDQPRPGIWGRLTI
jgi:hypothetical protein